MGACKSCFNWFFGCCGNQTHDPKSTTLVTDRGCTDKLMLLLYIVATALSVVLISISATQGGDPNKIISGIDYNGNICGKSSATKDFPYAALVNPLTTDSDAFKIWTCVQSCTDTQDASNTNFANLYGSTECQIDSIIMACCSSCLAHSSHQALRLRRDVTAAAAAAVSLRLLRPHVQHHREWQLGSDSGAVAVHRRI